MAAPPSGAAVLPPGTATAAVLALAGGAVAAAIGLPNPWLLGPMATTLTAALSGWRLAVPEWLPRVVLVVIGVNVGGALTPAMAAQAVVWLPSLAGLGLALAAALAAGVVVLWRGGGHSLPTAFYGAFPGHLMMALAGAAAHPRADLRTVAVAQSVRLVMLVSVVPSFLDLSGGGPLPAVPVTRDPLAITVAAAAGLAGALAAQRLKVPAGLLTGSILGAGAAALAGWSVGPLPRAGADAMLAIVGAMIGARFVGGRVRELLRLLPWSLAAVLAAMAASALVALPVAALTGLPLGDLLLAYSPGGADVMPLIAASLGLQPAFVALHHVARLLAMAVVLPLLAHRLDRK